MSQEFKINRLRFTYEGVWTPGNTYNIDAIVQYDGRMYVALVANTASSNFWNDFYYVNPTTLASTPYWALVVDGKSYKGVWTTGTQYGLGNIVQFGGLLFICTTQHVASGTIIDSTKWTQYNRFSNWHTSWQPNTVYGIGDIVKYGGIVYNCNTAHTSAASVTLGLEANQSSWSIQFSGIEFKGTWSGSNIRYKANDLVKLGPDLYECTAGHTSSSSFATGNWQIYLPGIDLGGTWSSSVTYQPGDVVQYGGFDFISAAQNNLNNTPSLTSSFWTLLAQGYELRTDWSSQATYKIGDVVRRNGGLYEAFADTNSTTGAQDPSTSTVSGPYLSAGSSGTTINLGGVFSATWSSNNTVITPSNGSSTAGILVGDIIAASGIPAGTTITNISNTGALTLSNQTTAGNINSNFTGYAASTTLTVLSQSSSSAPIGVGYLLSGGTPSDPIGAPGSFSVPGVTISNQVTATINTVSIATASGDGTTATLIFSAAQTYAPYTVGQKITVSSVSVSGYNGTYTVTACTTTQVQYLNTTTSAATGGSAVTTSVSTTQASGGTSGTNTFVVASATGITAGMLVTGTGVPAGTYVISTYTTGTTITLVNGSGTAQNFTTNATGTYNFYQPGFAGTYTISTASTVGSSSKPDTGINADQPVKFGVGGIVPGMIIQAAGFTQGQSVTSVNSNGTQVILNYAPDGTLTNGQTIAFTAVNSTYWKFLVPGTNWTFLWNPLVTYTGVVPTTISGAGSGATFTVSATGSVYSLILTSAGSGFNAGDTLKIPGSLVGGINGVTTPVPAANNDITITVTSVNYAAQIGTFTFTGTSIGKQYVANDLVVWKNATYICTQTHTATALNRPDLDTTGTYWTLYVAHARKNAMSTYGDLETYNSGSYQAVPIGTQSYTLRNTNNVPGWSKINQVTNVFYVAPNGVDRSDYGTTWDQAFKTINYACKFVQNGVNYPNTTYLLTQNKVWLATEVYYWMLSQKTAQNAPFTSSSTFDQTKTIRDSEYVIDALIYDLSRGGNSQTVAAALSYFAQESLTQFITTNVGLEMPLFIAALTELLTLITTYVLTNTVESTTYQTLNSVPTGSQALQVTNSAYTPEAGASTAISSLMSIITTALTNQNKSSVPPPNSGITATIFVKTGTYNETLPIIVPENTAIVGDELRSVVVQPNITINTYCTQTDVTNLFTVLSTAGMYDGCPVQFVDPNIATNISYSTFGGVVAGQTYYVIGTTITPTQFAVSSGLGGTLTANISASSNVVSVSSTTNLTVGMYVTGPGIPSGAKIATIPGSGSITLSTTATATYAGITMTYSGTPIILSYATGSIGLGTAMAVYGGDAIRDMFRLRNGTGLRNMTLVGLLGTLLSQDSNQIQRPSGGAFACLDPGTGPTDTSAWIFRRSPYVQNISSFGNGCVGLKIDGTLHNGGNKSIVTNDFTHIISDGIGVWCTGTGALTECVSIFSYYGYAGYFAEAGGRIRATNGNSSYGAYGVIAEGYDITETPATGIIYNQSTQTQATIESTFGQVGKLIHLNFTNAGSSYYTTTTNLLQYSNIFTNAAWSTDGNITLSQTITAPTGYAEAWSITGTGGTNTSTISQAISIPAAGGTYTNIAGSNVTGTGTSATFNVTVAPSGYVVTVNNPGTGYVVSNIIKILGNQVGGAVGLNDITVTVSGLSGASSINTVTSAGTVPAGTALSYTFSVDVQQGTAASVDLYATWSGTTSVTSAINFNFTTGVVTPSSINGGLTPVNYKAQVTTSAGWYRLWFAAYDTAGPNNTLTFTIYSKGVNGATGTYSYVYGPQVEISPAAYSPSFYLQTTNNQYTAYANYNITGAGTGALVVGEETRSNAVFNSRIITDSNSITGGLGYLTASNQAQGGDKTSIQLSQADVLLASNYVGMRVFINSGTGSGQYGFISAYNPTNATVAGIPSKTASVMRESFNTVQVVATTDASGSPTNYVTINNTANLNSFYAGMPVQFIPTYYSTVITSTNLSQTLVTQSTGGTITTTSLTVASTSQLAVGMPVQFSGTIFTNVIPAYTYYVSAILNSTQIQISVSFGSGTYLLTAGSGSFTMNFPSNNSYLQAPTANMQANYPVQFTGTSLGGITTGNQYYIQDVIDTANFTVASSLVTVSIASATTTAFTLTALTATTNLIPCNPIIFSGTGTPYGLSIGQKYYISAVTSATTFTISNSLLNVVCSATTYGTNLITCSSTGGFIVGNPIIFTGTTFGGIQAETVYYIAAISDSQNFTVSSTITYVGGVGTPGTPFGLSNGTGGMSLRTCASNLALTAGTTTITGTSTGPKTKISLGQGSMTATFSTPLFGGLLQGVNYYVNAILSSTTFTLASSLANVGGTQVALISGTGSMNVGMSGWDNVTPGTPSAAVLDSTTVYYIEPKTTYSDPAFSSVTTGSVVTLSPGSNWASIAYGAGTFIGFPNTGNTAATSPDGSAWTQINLPITATLWGGVVYGAGYFVAVSNTTAIYSSSAGAGFKQASMPSSQSWSSIAYGNGTFVTIASGSTRAAYSSVASLGSTWTAATLPSSQIWTGLAYGKNTFVAISSGGNTLTPTAASGSGSTATLSFATQSTAPYTVGQTIVVSGMTPTQYNGTYVVTGCTTSSVSYANPTTAAGTIFGSIVGNSVTAYSANGGSTWTTGALPLQTTWASIVFGNGRFVAVSSAGTATAYSFDGITWYSSYLPVTASYIAYGQGTFLAVQPGSTTAYISDSGLDWLQRTLAVSISTSAINFGFNAANVGVFSLLAGQNSGATVSAGVRAKARPLIASNVMYGVSLFEPGSNYTSAPTITFTDPNYSVPAAVVNRISNGTLGNPTFINNGTGYNTTSTGVAITGNGFADTYQTGLTIVMNNLSRQPLVGDNLVINGISQVFKVTSAVPVYGTSAPFLEANVSLSPPVTTANSTANGTTVSIRSKYSQARLTNHDFLNIGYGDQLESNYPGFPAAGYVAITNNQTIEANFGRVFFTSTDQDGNFKVGNLFGVQQATGIITLSASQFGLQGLNSISLGGIAVGGSSVIIQQFSTDGTFVANSDYILPTQKAIKTYLTSRLSQGGANTYTGELVAGTIVVGTTTQGPNVITSTIPRGTSGSNIKMLSKVTITGAAYAGIDGNMQALDMFMRGVQNRGVQGF
jgi:hypothetical protein